MSAAPKTAALYVRCAPSLLARLDAARGEESVAVLVRRAVDRELVLLERAAMRTAADQRRATDADAERFALLELDQ